MPKALHQLTLEEALAGLKNRDFTSHDLVSACLDQIKKYDSGIHAFLEVNDQALKEAESPRPGPLSGIPVAVKDNFLTPGLTTTASSNILKGYLPHYESTVTARLKAAGAIVIGKTNMDAWAHGSSTETSDFGATLNPWNTAHLPGGSSGGSAAAVAADMCIFAIGSETAGSIRQPAAWCGVTGFKPTYGRVSRYGVIAMASSTDSPGPLAKTAADAALVLQIIAGLDPYDATSSPRPVPDFFNNLKIKIKNLRIGLPWEYLEVMQPDTRRLVEKAADEFIRMGHQVESISLIHPKYSIGVYTVVQRSEVSSNLARYDGLRFGSPRSGFGEEAKRRIMLGTYTLSSGYYDQYYNQAQKVRTLIVDDFTRAFEKYDLIINPASPGPALKVNATLNEPMFGEMQDILVEPSSIAGLPGFSVPCGFIDGLPVSFGLIGPQFSEALVLSAARNYQQATQWHHAKPRL